MKQLYYYDGEFYENGDGLVHIEDRAFQFGDGIFETIPVYGGKCFALPQHIAHYTRFMRELRLPIVDTDEDMVNSFQELIDKSGISDGVIYLQISRGHWPRQLAYPTQCFPHIAITISENVIDRAAQEKGVACSLEEDIRGLRCDWPTLNRMGNAIAAEMARKKNCREAILYRKDANVITEGTSSNFFIYREGILWTHPADNFVLAGVTRELIIKEILPKLKITVVEKSFAPEFAYGADEAFICGSEIEILPVVRLNYKDVGGRKVGPITKQIIAAFNEYRESELAKIHLTPKETEISAAIIADFEIKPPKDGEKP